MRFQSRWLIAAVVCLIAPAAPAFADDGPTLYKQLCATCHDKGVGRAPTRDVLQAMPVVTSKAPRENAVRRIGGSFTGRNVTPAQLVTLPE